MSKSGLYHVIQNSLSVKLQNHLPYGQNSCDMYSTVAHILVFVGSGLEWTETISWAGSRVGTPR